MKRRDFLKASLGGGAALLGAGAAEARGNLEPAEEAVGMLYDSTLCIGCKACVSKCKEVNGMPPTPLGEETQWDSAHGLSPETLNVIKVYSEGKGHLKDQVEDGYASRSAAACTASIRAASRSAR